MPSGGLHWQYKFEERSRHLSTPIKHTDLAHCLGKGIVGPFLPKVLLHIRAVTLVVIEGGTTNVGADFNDPVLCLSCISSIARVSWCNMERCFIRLLKSAFDRLAQLRQCFSAKPNFVPCDRSPKSKHSILPIGNISTAANQPTSSC